MPSANIINGYDYADLRATSYLPNTPKITGLILWPKDSAISAAGRQPIGLTAVDDKLLVRYPDYLELRTRANGGLIWGREVHFACDIQVTSDGILSRDFAGSYEIVSFDSKVKEGRTIPFLGERTRLRWVLDSKAEIQFAYSAAPIPVHGTKGTPIEASASYGRLSPDSEMPLWLWERPSVYRGARMNSDGSKVCLGTFGFIDLFPANASKHNQVVSVPAHKLQSISVDHEDNILVVDEFEEKTRLRSLDFSGKQLWSVDLKSAGEIIQPVVSAPGGRLWLTVGGTIYHYVGSDLKWEHALATENQVFLTACADNSLLVANDSLFTRLSEQGEPMINRVFSGKFTCRPLVDGQGRIYLGGTQGLICLQ